MRRLLIGIGLAGALGAAVFAWHGSIKPLPQGLSVQTPSRRAAEVRFIADLTYLDPSGTRQVDQQIFDEILETIRAAREQITLDFFLFNEYQGQDREETRALCRELTDTLVQQKQTHPEIEIVLITDPINTVYGGLPAPHLERLEAAGISVVMTDLNPLRDSNALYSSLWRWFIQPLGEGSSAVIRFRSAPIFDSSTSRPITARRSSRTRPRVGSES